MLVRSLTLKSSGLLLAPFWPIISDEMKAAFSSILQHAGEDYNGWCLLQAAKLLDLLLLVKPDDFQLHEWLFVTDTVDVIYPPDGWQSSALVDEVAMEHSGSSLVPHLGSSGIKADEPRRRPWLCSDRTRNIPQESILNKILRPFFGQLSILAFESTYSLDEVDTEACSSDLLADLFNDETIAS